MNKQEKTQELSVLTDRFKNAKALIFTNFRKLKVAEMTELRSKLRKSESTFKVIKNRLAKRVLADEGLNDLNKYIDGPTAIATSDNDPAGVAKVLVDFAKDHAFLKMTGGYAEGRELSLNDITSLALLPSREILLAKALASMNAPATNLACVLQAIPQNLVRAINAIKEQKK